MKGTRRRSLAQRVQALARHRAAADERVGGRADILGSMLALKLAGGDITSELGITYFVKRKLLETELRPRTRVPKTLQIEGFTISTDVLEWPRMVDQSANGYLIFDQRQQGTLSCVARSGGKIFGVSCGHCLLGVDGKPATPTPVSVFSDVVGDFVQVGGSVAAVFSPGAGTSGDFGYLDCGLFSLVEPHFRALAEKAHAIPTVPNLHAMLGKWVLGVSGLNVAGYPTHQRRALVLGVEANAMGELCDLVLRVDSPGTFHGDSGLLWLTASGAAVGIHARGELTPPPAGSRLVTAMSAERAARLMNVEFGLIQKQ